MDFKSIVQTFIFTVIFSFSLSAHGVVIVNATGEYYMDLTKSYVDVKVNNQIAVVKTTQTFTNNWPGEISGKYAFPLPANSNAIKLRWRIGRKWSEAIISANSQDTSVPGNGGSTGPSGTLSDEVEEYLGDSPLFFATNDMIPPGQTITYELTYVQLLPYSYGEVNFEYPNDYSAVTPIPLEEYQLSFILESSRSITSIDVSDYDADVAMNNNLSTVVYTGNNELPTLDYKISYKLNSDQLGTYTMSTFLDSVPDCDTNLRGFTSMIIEPESNVDTEVIEKNFTLIIDRSGSMKGSKFEQAKSAANFIVNNLNEGDNFNILSFNDRVISFKTTHVPYNAQNQTEALDFIEELKAFNATNIGDAIGDAVDQFAGIQEDKANIIIFFTDGVATAGYVNREEILEHIRGKVTDNETNIFLFTLGVGTDVDKGLLTLLAREHNGLVDFVENEDILQDITDLFLRINNPVMINTAVTFEPANIIREIFPKPLSNLYKGEQLILSGRYGESNPVKMTLTGNAYNVPVSYSVNLALADTSKVNQSFLPKIWAKQKIDVLSQEYDIAETQASKKEIQDEIDELSICYGVISTDFNSFVEEVLEFNLLEFKVEAKNNSEVNLNWVTSMESNNFKFVIQRSNNLEDWTDIGERKGAGNSAENVYYSFIDENPNLGKNYYRLKQIDYDGTINYSDIRVAVIKFGKQFSVFPNPIEGNNILNINWDEEGSVNIEIFNTVGQRVHSVDNFTGRKITLPSLLAGQYSCHFIKGENMSIVRFNIN